MEERDIIAEIRAYRDAYAARFGYDFRAMVRDIQSRERAGGSFFRHPRRNRRSSRSRPPSRRRTPRPADRHASRPFAANQSSMSLVSVPALSIRGTLFCPPYFPRAFIQSANPPAFTTRTSGTSIVRSPTRWAA